MTLTDSMCMDNQSETASRALNLCTVCGRDFGGVRAFDMHRTGRYEDGRECLSDEAMLAKGMYINAQGRWSQPENGRSQRLG
jgi:hypothetical protein